MAVVTTAPLGHSGAEVACRSRQVARVVWHVFGRLRACARCACMIPSSGYPIKDSFLNMTFLLRRGSKVMDVSKSEGPGAVQGAQRDLEIAAPVECNYFAARGLRRDDRLVQLQLPGVTSTSPVFEGLLFRYRLAQGAFESCCRSSVFVRLRLVTVVRPWRTYSFGRLNLLDSLLRLTYAMAAVYLDFGIQQMNYPFFYSLTRRSMVQVHPTRARNNDTWDRRRIVNNMS
jgi:hypothetical protein